MWCWLRRQEVRTRTILDQGNCFKTMSALAVATRGSEAAEEAVVALQQAAKLNRMDGLKRKIYRKLLSLHGFHHHVKGFPEHVPFNQFWPTCLAIQRSSESSDQKDHPNGPGSCDVVTCISVRVKLRYSPSLGWFMKENCQIRVSCWWILIHSN